MLLEVIVDINAGEKTLMMMWNEHVISYAGLGQDDLTRVLSDFVKYHIHAVSDLCLDGNFVCHFNYHAAGWLDHPWWTPSPTCKGR